MFDKSYRKFYVVATVLFALVAGLLVYFSTPLSRINLQTGYYSYDPRSQAPDPLIMENRPEEIVLKSIAEGVKANGTYPREAGSKVTKYAAVQVSGDVRSNLLKTYVDVIIYYEDGKQNTLLFELWPHRTASNDLLNVTFKGYYPPTMNCSTPPSGKWMCL